MKRLIYSSLYFCIAWWMLSACQQPYQADNGDWPMYQHDNFRSAKSALQLDMSRFGEAWVYKSRQYPEPAWFGPAKWDAWADIQALPSMRNYDPVFHPIVIHERMYFGSSADDGVHCLNTKTGKEEWVFSTEAPVRIAPTYHNGNIYFGSDDGYAYCVNAEDGELIWKVNPVEEARQILFNDRLISLWPIRTGVIVEDNIAYFGASMMPWKTSYLCAVNAATGKIDGKGTFIKEYEDLSLEGPLVSSGEKLIIPQGRISPFLFDRATGDKIGQLPGSGGCFVLVTPEKHIVHTPTSRKKSISITGSLDEPSLMTYEYGKAMVVSGDTAFILSDYAISAFSRTEKKTIWTNKTYNALSIVQGGDVIYAGGIDTVYAINARNGRALWKNPVKGLAFGLALADSALFASTHEGQIYCFRENITTHNSLYAGAMNAAAAPVPVEEQDGLPKVTFESVDEVILGKRGGSYELETGPYVQYLSKDKVEITWHTTKPSPTFIKYGMDTTDVMIQDEMLKTSHKVVLSDLRKNYVYFYQVGVQFEEENATTWTQEFELDNFFNYYQFTFNEEDRPFEKDENLANTAAKMLETSGLIDGIGVMYGLGDGQLAFELAIQSDLNIIVFDTRKSAVEKLRQQLQNAGVYGKRLSVRHVGSYQQPFIPSEFANLVIVQEKGAKVAEEAQRVLAPKGTAFYAPDAGPKTAMATLHTSTVEEPLLKSWDKFQKPEIDGAGEWSHQYGNPDNSNFGGESLWGTTTAEDFEIQWVGRPGPRFQADRSGRKTSPLATNGRLFVQGLKRIGAIDMYNGRFLWVNSMPGFMRYNMPRDCSNWCADENYLYTVLKSKCYQLDAATGKVIALLDVVPSQAKNWEQEWGYLAQIDNQLIGSAQKAGASYKKLAQGFGWYDAVEGEVTKKVCSDNLFSLNKEDGSTQWVYESPGVIINPTITISDQQTIYVAEARHPSAKASDSRRLEEELWKNLHLTAIDLKTGQEKWSRPLEVVPGKSVFYLLYSNGMLVASSSADETYYVYGLKAENGEKVWEQTVPWKYGGHHGGHMQKPAIFNNKVLSKPYLFDLFTGEKLETELPKNGHGCGSYACTEQSVFYRGGSVTMWNAETTDVSDWNRLRPDCWISTIPAGGMVLSPEGGGGCSCGSWLETSMAFAPKYRAPVMIDSRGVSQFIDSLQLTLKVKEGVKGTLRYTLDGSLPTEASSEYTKPFEIEYTTTVTVGLFTEGNQKPLLRSKTFTRLFPEPEIKPLPAIKNGTREIELSHKGITGTIRYTTDGSEPTTAAEVYEKPVVIQGKTVLKAKVFWKDPKGKIYESALTEKELEVPVLRSASTVETQPGIRFEYFEGSFKKLPDFSELPVLKSGVQAQVDHTPRQRDVKYALRFTGYIEVPEDGVYHFFTQSDDASAVYIGDEKVVDHDGSHGASEKSGSIALAKGLHPITVTHYQGTGGQLLNLSYEGPGLEKQVVPATALSHQSLAQ
ncbi:PQQ-binding-like beta-propeller repeat protein [Rapidithrix thailandica]|uniref:PQQ-binding-like beta-propeller repeat protein n=1 Tax=Rapidithrix thailandica TaxID=413964 RepID=A0AAW9S3X1_9BACT